MTTIAGAMRFEEYLLAEFRAPASAPNSSVVKSTRSQSR